VCPQIPAGNTFQDIPRLCETADNFERNIYCDVRVTNINTVRFIDKRGLSKHKHCDNVATNANSENGRSRIEASFAGKQ
jgi:hypothetical protein